MIHEKNPTCTQLDDHLTATCLFFSKHEFWVWVRSGMWIGEGGTVFACEFIYGINIWIGIFFLSL